MKKIVILLGLVATLLSCAYGPSMTVKQQGDIQMVMQQSILKKDMTMGEVKTLIGEPQRIRWPIWGKSTQYWHYSSHSEIVQAVVEDFSHALDLTFKDGKLVHAIRGGFMNHVDLVAQ